MEERNRNIMHALMERWHDLQIVGKLLYDPQVPILHKLIPLAALLYFFSPIDLSPDVLFGPGQVDDVAVILFALAMFLRVAPQERVAAARALFSGTSREHETEVVVEKEEYHD